MLAHVAMGVLEIPRGIQRHMHSFYRAWLREDRRPPFSWAAVARSPVLMGGGFLVLGFSFFFCFWGPWKARDEAGKASTKAPRRVQNRPPRRPKWAAVGREMAAHTALAALLGGSCGGFGASWVVLCVSLAFRGAPGGGKGTGSEFWCFFWMIRRQKARNSRKLAFLLVFVRFFGPGLGFGLRLLFVCVPCARWSMKYLKIMKSIVFCGSKGIGVFFAEAGKDQKFRAAACREEVEKRDEK